MKQACIIGMGYVGLTLGVALAAHGYRITGIENNPETLERLKNGRPLVHEPYLAEIYRDLLGRGQISLHGALPDSCDCANWIITVGTPLGRDDHVDNTMITQAAEMVAGKLKAGDLVVLRSTVAVGTTRNLVRPILDRANTPYCLAMCPERTLEGNALSELSSLPQIIGGLDQASVELASQLFEPLGMEQVVVSQLEVAELAKIACNAQRDLRFAFSNEIAIICNYLNIDALEVIEAANRHYTRSNIARPGPVAGPCLEKDIYILRDSLLPDAPEPYLSLAGRKRNESVARVAIESMRAANPHAVKKIALLGLAFKGDPPTGDMRGSMAIKLYGNLRRLFPEAEISAYDPVVDPDEAGRWGLPRPDKLEDALAGAGIILIQTNHKCFATEKFSDLASHLAPEAYVYDFWHILDAEAWQKKGMRIDGLGRPCAQ